MAANDAHPAPGSESGPRRILLVRLGALGDVVRTLPALRLMRESWPDAEFAWAIERGHAALLEGHPDVDHRLVLERSRLTRAARSLRSEAFALLGDFIGEVRAFRPDLTLDFQSSLKSGLVSRLSGAPLRWGFGRQDARESSHVFATHHLELDDPRTHRVERAARLAIAAGARPGPLRADLALRDDELAEARARVAGWCGDRPAVALAPFSSTRQAWKRYPLECWSAVARQLAGSGASVLVVAGPSERDEASRLVASTGEHVRIAEDSGIRSLAAILASCRLFVGGDTGPMHIAWAAGTPVVALYGPTDPALNAPFGPGHVVLAPETPSSRQDEDRFPGLTPETIVRAARERLAALAPPPHGDLSS